MKSFIHQLQQRKNLSTNDMTEAAHQLLSNETSDDDIRQFLSALHQKGESVEEITAFVHVVKQHALPFPTMKSPLFDNCGTGGDQLQSFNVSTTSAFVLAGAGVRVAKHGNRSITSQSGSADVLEALDVPIDMTPQAIHQTIDDIGIAFLFAPAMHPTLKRIQGIRKTLQHPTIFNLIGPLTNPAPLTHQFIGLYRRDKLQTIASVLKELGRKQAIVLTGAGGMDEASLVGENELILLKNGSLHTMTVSPDDVGLPTHSIAEIRGGDAKMNAHILEDVLLGNESPYLSTVLFNAGIGLVTAEKADTFQEGVHIARESIRSGQALHALNQLQAKSVEKAEVRIG